jgi:hypothetical protein
MCETSLAVEKVDRCDCDDLERGPLAGSSGEAFEDSVDVEKREALFAGELVEDDPGESDVGEGMSQGKLPSERDTS